jgi:enoyl-CoA hydratase
VKVEIQKEKGIGTVLFSHGKGNTLTPSLLEEISRGLRSLEEDPDIRVIALKGDGENFSFGLDLRSAMEELAPLFSQDGYTARKNLYEFILRLQRLTSTPAKITKPVVALIRGYCIGVALELVSACDIRLADASARFSLREVKVAIVADLGGLVRLPLLIGEGRARELALTGGEISADSALQFGLVQRVFSTSSFGEEAESYLREMATLPSGTLRGIKEMMNGRTEPIVEESLKRVALWNSSFLLSPDLLEALSAFQEKRTPRFG